MKKLLLVIILVILGWSGYNYLSDGGASIKPMPASSRPDPSSATFIFEDGPLTFKDGLNQGDAQDLIPTETIISDEIVYGDINNDGKNDAVVLLIQNSGGSGTFIYLAGYVSGNVTYKGTNAVFIGDRVSPTGLTISENGVIRLDYLDRAPEAAMAEPPTIPQTRSFIFREGEIEEI